MCPLSMGAAIRLSPSSFLLIYCISSNRRDHFVCWLLLGCGFHFNEQITYAKFHCHGDNALRIKIRSIPDFGSQQKTETANKLRNDTQCYRLTPISALKIPNYSRGDAALWIFCRIEANETIRFDLLTGKLSNLIWHKYKFWSWLPLMCILQGIASLGKYCDCW